MATDILEKLRVIVNKAPVLEEHPRYSPLIEAVEQQISKAERFISYSSRLPFKNCPAYETLKNLSGSEKLEAVLYLANRVNALQYQLKPIPYQDNSKVYFIDYNLLDALMRTRIEFPQDFSFWTLFKIFYFQSGPQKDGIDLHIRPFGCLVAHLEKQVKKRGLDESLKKDIQAILEVPAVAKQIGNGAATQYWGPDIGKAVKKLQQLLAANDDNRRDVVPPYLLGNGKLGTLFSADLSALAQEQQNHWNKLFHHLCTAKAGKPTKAFLDTAEQLIDGIGAEPFKAMANKWFNAVAGFSVVATSHTYTSHGREHQYNTYSYIEAHNVDLLKGLLWSMGRFRDEQTLQGIALLTEKCFQKIPGQGPAAAGVGNAGIYTLAHVKGLEGVSHLSRLKLRIRQNNTQKLIQKYIDEQAKKHGIKPAQIEEMAVSDYGLTDGERSEIFDGYTLRLRLTGVGATELQWFKPDATPQKSVPAFVKSNEEFAAKLKKLQDVAKQVKQASSIQRDRIDRLYTENLSWSMADFERYYLQHGLVGPIARKLLWSLDGQAALYVEGHWQDETGAALDVNAQTPVRLWHPLDSNADTVLAWRDRLEALQIRQPFKQAYREIYLLTDAEIHTRVYSNRMAAHLLKQHQFSSLAALRGWKYSLLGAYDDGRNGEVAEKPLPEQDLIAQFWINEIMDDSDSFNEAGIWNYVATDQVRFCDRNGNAVPLIDVPPLIFSEIMRDVDLFVGVASVGNDPQWQDGGPDGRQDYRNYWHSYSFGDLTEVAKTRKSVLERLLPRLKIRNVAKIDGKFLIVQGKRHQYKIHIGSGNILIAPHDRYLCIVPGRDKDKSVGQLFLPFEGDKGLSVVLSKAFLLAEDDKITDPTILSQL